MELLSWWIVQFAKMYASKIGVDTDELRKLWEEFSSMPRQSGARPRMKTTRGLSACISGTTSIILCIDGLAEDIDVGKVHPRDDLRSVDVTSLTPTSTTTLRPEVC